MREFPFLRVTLLGLASWAIPFVISFLFVGTGGRLLLPEPLFKSVMVVVSGGVGAILLLALLRRARLAPLAGLLVGCYWLIINLGLDLLILLPMTQMGFADYAMSIAVRYLLIPMLAVSHALASRYHA